MSCADNFWTFALDRYPRPGVARCCLALQDRWGADVMLLLWCCWLGEGGRAVVGPDLRNALIETDPIQNHLLRPLRAARRALRFAEREVPSLRGSADRLQRAELAAERLEAELLERLARRHAVAVLLTDASVRELLAQYLGAAGIAHPDALEHSRELAACVLGDIQLPRSRV